MFKFKNDELFIIMAKLSSNLGQFDIREIKLKRKKYQIKLKKKFR